MREDLRVQDVIAATRSRVGGLVRRVRPGAAEQAPQVPAQPRPPRPAPVSGIVEQFSKRLVVGWISVPAGMPPVKVTLHLDDLQIAATYATPDGAMSGSGSATRGGTEVSGPPRSTGAPLVHSWQQPNVPGPDDDRRNSRRQIRTFSFRVRDIWQFARRSTKVTVRVNGRPLPIYGHGMFLSPRRKGAHTLDDLRARFDEGYLFSQYGRLQLTKQLDTEWQANVMRLYQQTRAILAETHGYDVFFVYGTLLGAVREGTYIGHDIDFDCAYLSQHSDPVEAAQELADIGLLLIERGFVVDCHHTALHLHDPDDPSVRIDLFHTFFGEDGRIGFPFGIAGTSVVTREDWQGTREIEFPGGKGLVPVNAEQMVEHLYGADWRVPKPGFNWNLDRTHASAGKTTGAQRSKVYWTNFYAHTEYTSGSTFFEFVNAWPDIPATVIDIGCGDGRDACAFGTAGRRVVGLDQSPVGIEHATNRAASLDLSGTVSFRTCDVADHDALTAVIEEVVGSSGDAPVLFYLRFFLHSITEEVQSRLMATIGASARPGDHLAAEFRTEKDEAATKVHGKHYRRFQSGQAFGEHLRDELSFTLLHEEEGTGLSPYQGEDPVLYRVVARR